MDGLLRILGLAVFISLPNHVCANDAASGFIIAFHKYATAKITVASTAETQEEMASGYRALLGVFEAFRLELIEGGQISNSIGELEKVVYKKSASWKEVCQSTKHEQDCNIADQWGERSLAVQRQREQIDKSAQLAALVIRRIMSDKAAVDLYWASQDVDNAHKIYTESVNWITTFSSQLVLQYPTQKK